ncbi:MAG: SulP family inorganic anion transporter [Desulfonatronovibrio sp.]
MPKIIQDMRHDLKPSMLFPALCIGVILGLLLTILELSFAAMIFAGDLSHLATRGAGLTLAGGLVVCAGTALFSSFKSVINLPQDAPVAIFSGVAAVLAVKMGSSTADEQFITVAAALILTTFLTAVFLFMIARFKLVHFFRYIPFPVVGGFLAGTGWILSYGSLEVMTGGNISLTGESSLFSSSVLALWLPGAVLAVLLFSILRRFTHFLILPLALIIGLAVFHAILYAGGHTLEEAREAGFLFETFSRDRLWPAFSWSDFSGTDWKLILTQVPVLLTIPLITLVGLLLNMGGIELASRKEIDMEREIMVNSVSNALACLAASPPAYSSLSLSMLGFKTSAYSRLVGLVAAFVLLLTLIWGGLLVSIFPKAVLGGFLMLLGLFFLWDWVVETWNKMTLPDYLIVLTILGVIAWQGFFQGVVLGILLSVILFVVRFSNVPILKEFRTGATTQSPRVRPLPHKRILLEQGERINIFELSGYLFFGSVNSLIATIQSKVENKSPAGPVYVLIDMEKVSGIDVSAVSAFVRMIHRLISQDVKIVFACAPSGFLNQIRQHLGPGTDEYFQQFSSLEQGQKWVEDKILEEQLSLLADKKTRHKQDKLFDNVAGEMLKKLEELEYIEEILHNLQGYSREIYLNGGSALLVPNQQSEGFYWVRQGRICEFSGQEEDSLLLAEYSPGDVINIAGVFAPRTINTLFRAETDCHVQFFPLDGIKEIESRRPDLAARIYFLLLKKAVDKAL